MNRLILLAAVAVLGQGCATVTRGTTQAWTVESEPVGAQVSLSSGEHCQTPCTLKKKRKDGFEVTVEHAGYEPVQTRVIPSVSGAGAAGMAGNVLVGGLIGVGVDAATGATKDLKPNPLIVKMAPVAAKTPEPQAVPASASMSDADATPTQQ